MEYEEGKEICRINRENVKHEKKKRKYEERRVSIKTERTESDDEKMKEGKYK